MTTSVHNLLGSSLAGVDEVYEPAHLVKTDRAALELFASLQPAPWRKLVKPCQAITQTVPSKAETEVLSDELDDMVDAIEDKLREDSAEGTVDIKNYVSTDPYWQAWLQCHILRILFNKIESDEQDYRDLALMIASERVRTKENEFLRSQRNIAVIILCVHAASAALGCICSARGLKFDNSAFKGAQGLTANLQAILPWLVQNAPLALSKVSAMIPHAQRFHDHYQRTGEAELRNHQRSLDMARERQRQQNEKTRGFQRSQEENHKSVLQQIENLLRASTSH